MPKIDLDKYLTIEDELSLEATECEIGIDMRAGQAKIEMTNKSGLLSVLHTDAPGLYDLAHKLLRAYDQLEGL